jgi:hypothetical protein
VPAVRQLGARSASTHPAYYENTAGNAAGSLAVRRLRSEPQAAVARRGWCGQARRLEQRLRSPGRMASSEKTAGNAARSRLPQAAKRATGGGGQTGVVRPGAPARRSACAHPAAWHAMEMQSGTLLARDSGTTGVGVPGDPARAAPALTRLHGTTADLPVLSIGRIYCIVSVRKLVETE